jgi:Carbohydrate binding domain/PEP-CTERM motif
VSGVEKISAQSIQKEITMMRVRSLAVLTFVTVLAVSSQASADLVVNGDFETGDFTGWSLSGNTGTTSVNNLPFNVHSGNFGAELGPIGSDGFLMQQNIGTTVGDVYQVSFWLHSDGEIPNDFSAIFGGVTGFSETDIPAADYTNYTFNVTAISATSGLTLSFRDDPGFLGLDDVSVIDLSTVPTPEPSTLAIGGVSGLLALAYGLRRKRAA